MSPDKPSSGCLAKMKLLQYNILTLADKGWQAVRQVGDKDNGLVSLSQYL